MALMAGLTSAEIKNVISSFCNFSTQFGAFFSQFTLIVIDSESRQLLNDFFSPISSTLQLNSSFILT